MKGCGSAGYNDHSPYEGSSADKSEQTKDVREQTGSQPTHDGQGDQ